MRRRMGRPGLMGMAARTAVVAGTATAVSGSVSRSSQAKSQHAAAFRQQQEAEAQSAAIAQAVAAQTAAAPPPPPPAAATGDGMIEALERLAALKSQGILTDEEFAAQKARILGG